MSNIYNVYGYIWTLVLIALCIIMGIFLVHKEDEKLKRTLRILVAATGLYIAGMILVLTHVSVLVVTGLILHFISQMAMFISMFLYLAHYFDLKGRLQADNNNDNGTESGDWLKKTEKAVEEGFNNAAESIESGFSAARQAAGMGVHHAAKAGEHGEEPEGGEHREEPDKKQNDVNRKESVSKVEIEQISYNGPETDEKTEQVNDLGKTDLVLSGSETEKSSIEPVREGSFSNTDSTETVQVSSDQEPLEPEIKSEMDCFFSTPECMLGKRVLAVDCNEDEISLIKKVFKDTGADVVCVSSGSEAIQLCRELSFDLLLIDHRLTDFDGVTAFSMIHRDEQGLNGFSEGIAISGEKRVKEEYYKESGFEEVIMKPLEAERLREAVFSWLNNYGREVGKNSTIREKLHYLEQGGLRVCMGLANEGNDMETYVMMLKNFRDESQKREERIDSLIEDISNGDDMWEFLLSQIGEVKKDVNELGNNELGELFNTIEMLIRAEDLDSIKARMPLVKNLWSGFSYMLAVL